MPVQRFLISFAEGAMDHIPQSELPAVSDATRAVVAEAKRAGVWIFGGGMAALPASVVAVDGSVGDAQQPGPKIGGFSIVEVESREEALEWAAKFAASCRCAQQVREIMYDPES